jgi:hypothetical protein
MSNLAIYAGPTTPAEWIAALEKCGGNLVTFCAEHCTHEHHQRWLFEIESSFTKDELIQWKHILRRSLESRLDYLQSKALLTLESENKHTTGEVAYAKMILDEILTARSERIKKSIGFPYAWRLATARGTQKPGEEGTGEPPPVPTDPERDEIDDLLDEEKAS